MRWRSEGEEEEGEEEGEEVPRVNQWKPPHEAGKALQPQNNNNNNIVPALVEFTVMWES